MKKKLIKTGNSAALVIEKSTLEALGLEPQSQVLVQFDGEKITMQPTPTTREMLDALLQASEKTQQLLAEILKKLEG